MFFFYMKIIYVMYIRFYNYISIKTNNGFFPCVFLIKLKDPIVPKGLFSFINLILYFGFNSSSEIQNCFAFKV